LKRTIPQKAGSTPASTHSTGTDSNSGEDRSPRVDDSIHLKANRRASAAKFGIVFSVGTCGFLFSHTGDAAIAAEPTAAETLAFEPSAQPGLSTQDMQPPQGVAAHGEVSSTQIQSGVEHRVQQGQTVWRIAEIYKVNPHQIVSVNQLRPDSALRVGQSLQIPPSGQLSSQAPSQMSSQASSQVPSVVAVAGTRVPVIAAGLPAANAPVPSARLTVNPALLSAGAIAQQESLKLSLAELRSEESKGVVATTEGLVNYQVSPGETLIAIARNQGVSYQALLKLNNLTNPDQLVANQVIKLPTEKSVAATLPTAVPVVQASAVPTVQSLPLSDAKSEAKSDAKSDAKPFVAMGGESPSSLVMDSGVLVPQAAVPALSPIAVKPEPRFSGSLMSEVKSLRQRNAAKSPVMVSTVMAPRPTAVPSAVPLIKALNPDFLPEKQAGMLVADVRSLAQPSAKRDVIVPLDRSADKGAELSKKPQLLARAPLGADAYAPVSPSMRRMVAPNLPPIGRPDAYLPGGQTAFKGYIWPAKGEFTSGYGPRWGRMHKGIDVAAATGTPIVAAAPGVVVTAGWNSGGYGYLVEINHPDGTMTLYGHNDSIMVREGQQVAQGEQIARMGSTGHSTGPHTHFEIHLPGQGAVNPVAYLDNRS
jgi:murein DD-endopeptidase MepM/ murein hydrolase activator NlpD